MSFISPSSIAPCRRFLLLLQHPRSFLKSCGVPKPCCRLEGVCRELEGSREPIQHVIGVSRPCCCAAVQGGSCCPLALPICRGGLLPLHRVREGLHAALLITHKNYINFNLFSNSISFKPYKKLTQRLPRNYLKIIKKCESIA